MRKWARFKLYMLIIKLENLSYTGSSKGMLKRHWPVKRWAPALWKRAEVSKLGFFEGGFTTAYFKRGGTTPQARLLLIIAWILGPMVSKKLFKSAEWSHICGAGWGFEMIYNFLEAAEQVAVTEGSCEGKEMCVLMVWILSAKNVKKFPMHVFKGIAKHPGWEVQRKALMVLEWTCGLWQ